MATKLAIIGGTGLTQFSGLEIINEIDLDTPYGKPSTSIIIGKYHDKEVLFLPRHGQPHTIPPHKVNYRANIWALNELGIKEIIAVNAVGGITAAMAPCHIVIPDQLIDYTHSRIDTFHEDDLEEVIHIDFTEPYSASIRKKLIGAAAQNNINMSTTATYGVTQGPRLETAAEVKRLEKDGCDIVGMTSMPEASLARELEIDYACCALVVNWAAGKTADIITMEIIEANLKLGMSKIHQLIATVLENK